MINRQGEPITLIDTPDDGPIVVRTIYPGEEIPPASWHETRQQRRRQEREARKRKR